MAKFKSYGVEINVADKYTEGQPLSANDAQALNARMAEFISHRIRATVFTDLEKGSIATEEQRADAQTMADKLVTSFEFNQAREAGETRVVDPVEKEAKSIATSKVRAAIKTAGRKLLKKDEVATDENDYTYEAYAAKVKEVAEMPAIVAAAKKAVKAREASGDDEVTL